MNLKGYRPTQFERGAPPWKEAFWLICREIFFDNSLPWPSAWRVTLLRIFGAKIGEGVVIRAKVNINFPWKLTIGDYVWLGEDAGILSLAPVTIESHVCISQRAYLCTGSHDFRSEEFTLITKPIVVREGSWIAAGAFIGPGVEIGPGAMVTAGTVVSASVPPRSIAKGNPAIIKQIA